MPSYECNYIKLKKIFLIYINACTHACDGEKDLIAGRHELTGNDYAVLKIMWIPESVETG